MMKIDTLIDDIYSLLDEGTPLTEEACESLNSYGWAQSEILEQRLSPRGNEDQRLRLSSIGKPCVRQLWYGLHASHHREPLMPHTRLKFLYGDLIETMLLELVRRSGHLVEGEQGSILVNDVGGHRDCVIDGMLVDVKSASPYSFKKFQGGLQREDDAFGYLTQLGSYLLGSKDDPLVTYKNEAAFLVIDKVSGHIYLDRHTFTEEDFDNIKRNIEERKGALSKPPNTSVGTPDPVPPRAFEPVDQNKPNLKTGWVNGNKKLAVNCSYCDFKDHCWPELRTFLYSSGPVFLTHVEKEPNNVPEVK